LFDQGAIFHQPVQFFKTKFLTRAINTIIVLIYFYKKEYIIITAVDSWKTSLFLTIQNYKFYDIHIPVTVIHNPGCCTGAGLIQISTSLCISTGVKLSGCFLINWCGQLLNKCAFMYTDLYPDRKL